MEITLIDTNILNCCSRNKLREYIRELEVKPVKTLNEYELKEYELEEMIRIYKERFGCYKYEP